MQTSATAPTQEPKLSLPLRLAYAFLEANNLATEGAAIRTSPERLGSYTSSLRAAKIVGLLREKGLLDKFIETNWPLALEPAGKKKLAKYGSHLFKVQDGWPHSHQRHDRS
jgi:hypothetical protein